MARDYKNAGRKNVAERKPISGWVWLITGLCIGWFSAFVFMLSQEKSDTMVATSGLRSSTKPASSPKPNRATPPIATSQDEPSADTAADPPTTAAAPQFDFYTILPEMEVAVPENEIAASDKEVNSPVVSKHHYLLQAGSFRTYGQADRLKASLALLGVPAKIQEVQINQNDRWHRVRIGPFSSAREIDRVRRRLGDENIHTILVRLK